MAPVLKRTRRDTEADGDGMVEADGVPSSPRPKAVSIFFHLQFICVVFRFLPLSDAAGELQLTYSYRIIRKRAFISTKTQQLLRSPANKAQTHQIANTMVSQVQMQVMTIMLVPQLLSMKLCVTTGSRIWTIRTRTMTEQHSDS